MRKFFRQWDYKKYFFAARDKISSTARSVATVSAQFLKRPSVPVISFSALLLLLFFTPISIAPLDLYKNADAQNSVVSLIFAFRFPPLWVLPAVAVFTVLTFFLRQKIHKDFRVLNYALAFASLSLYLICAAFCVIANANCLAWFLSLPFYIYLLALLVLALHFYHAFKGIICLRRRNPEYAEYSALHRTHKLSIKSKFTFVIIALIIVILFTFMLLILNRYKKMFTEAVSDVGRAQAEQTAAVYDSAEGKYEKIARFFEEQRISNDYAETPFERIDIIIYAKSEPAVFLDSWEAASELPEFSVLAYTTGRPKEIADSEKSLTNAQAVDYLKRYKNGAYKKEFVFDKANHTCKYIYPVTLERGGGRKLIGFAIVTYRQQVLMRQFFRTKIFVYTIIAVFLYLTVILSILLADFIFNPILFLRKNVRNTSISIETMLSGSAKDASAALAFSETIRTKDEIKDLSLEIGEMVRLINGIMPYVSFSTLKHAEKVGDADSASAKKDTTSRDLCFLFTDIRGFTSLCEGMPPKKVVELLNHYLEIETQIILDNGGDVDKFVGDEMMAFFSGARKEINACKAAMEIREAMREQQQLSMKDGTVFVSIGIGINTGEVVFGSVGSRTRKDFTSIGDTVNLAARLESANKAYGSKSIITEAVFNKLRGLFICRELDLITVKGKTEPVRIYEILQQKSQAKKSNAADKLIEIKTLFEQGLSLYRGQKWAESEKCFTECAAKYNDLPSVVFLDRINHFKSNPPPSDWDGVFKMSVK